MMAQNYLIGLPAYNEEKNIEKLLDKAAGLKPSLGENLRVLVVNDGSTDRTEAILKSFAERHGFIGYLNHPQNLGLGKAVDTLVRYAVQNLADEDILITCDADNTHNPKIIPAMIEKLNAQNLDIVIASRFTDGGKETGLSAIRKLYSRGAMLFCSLIFPIKNVRDYSCGYRAYRVGFLKKLAALYGENLVTSSGFECMVEILAKAGKASVRAGEYPLVLEYGLKQGESKMRVGKTIKGYLRLALKVRKPKTEIGA